MDLEKKKAEKSLTQRIRECCRYYAINVRQDALWMEELSWGSGRFDLLTVNLSDWVIRGYEIKVNRSDFVGDRKWQHYLPYVHFFYFASPKGLIDPAELPAEIGLLELLVDEPRSESQVRVYGRKKDGEPSYGLALVKKPKRLQPSFVRHTYGEQFMTRMLLSFIRNIQWRDARLNGHCLECGHRMEFFDPRASIRDLAHDQIR